MKRFKEAALGDAAVTAEYEDRLRALADERFAAARERLRATSERAAEAMLAAESAKLRAMMEAPNAALPAVEAELRRFLAEYDAKVAGPWKYKRASEVCGRGGGAGGGGRFEEGAGRGRLFAVMAAQNE
jgi:hypothetical protein